MTGVDRVTTAFPPFVPDGAVVTTGKSVVAFGTVQGAPAAAKWLTHRGREWRDRFRHEIRVYQRLHVVGGGGVAPPLFFADPKALLLVVGRARGRALSRERYPERDVAPKSARDVVAALDHVAWWRPWRIASIGRVYEEHERRVTRYRKAGWLPDPMARLCVAATRRLARERVRPAFAHGDVIGPNVFVGSRTGLIDWEFAGYHLPHYDLALLWVVAQRQPAVREAIVDRVAGSAPLERLAFAASVATLLGRERKIHDQLPAGHRHRWRLDGMAADLPVAHAMLTTLPRA